MRAASATNGCVVAASRAAPDRIVGKKAATLPRAASAKLRRSRFFPPPRLMRSHRLFDHSFDHFARAQKLPARNANAFAVGYNDPPRLERLNDSSSRLPRGSRRYRRDVTLL